MSAKPQVKIDTKGAKPQVKKVAPPSPSNELVEIRTEIFMTAYRMQATVKDAQVAIKSGLHELARGHLEEMDRILQGVMNKYR